LAVIAAFLAAGKVEVLAEGVEEGGAGVEDEGVREAVDLEIELDGGTGGVGVVGSGEGGYTGGSGGADDAGGFEEAAAGDFNVRWRGFRDFRIEEVGVGTGSVAHGFASQIHVNIRRAQMRGENLSLSTICLMMLNPEG
jgi:hypothetical protein